MTDNTTGSLTLADVPGHTYTIVRGATDGHPSNWHTLTVTNAAGDVVTRIGFQGP